MTDIADERRQDEGVRERAASTMQQAASVTQEKAVELREKSAGQVRQQLDARTTDAGRQARSVAQALRRSGEDLRGQGNDQAARVTESTAQRVEALGDYLQRVDGDQLLRDAERFARERPWLVAGVGLFAGLVASRVIKASSERRYAHGSSISSASTPSSSRLESDPLGRPRGGEFDDLQRGA